MRCDAAMLLLLLMRVSIALQCHVYVTVTLTYIVFSATSPSSVINQHALFSVSQRTVEAWRTVFYIAGGVYAFGTVFYGLFGSGEVQPWAAPHIAVLDAKVDKKVKEKSNKLLKQTTG